MWSDSPLCGILNSPSDNDEVIIAKKKSKYDKAAGMEGIPIEFLENLLVVISIYSDERLNT